MKEAKIITTATLKGGVGKSNFTFNLAGLLGENNKVLLIDVDPQTNLSMNCGVDATSNKLKTIRNVFIDNVTLSEVVFKNPIEELPNIDLIPSSIGLYDTEMKISKLKNPEKILSGFFKQNKESINFYDYIIIDTNPSFSLINRNALLVADSIILISDTSPNSIQGVELLMALWDNERKVLGQELFNIKSLILNNFDKRINLSKELDEYCRNNINLNDILLSNVIYSSVKMKDTEIAHKPINILYKNSTNHENYKNILEELKMKGGI